MPIANQQLQQILALFSNSGAIVVNDSPLLSHVEVEEVTGGADNKVVQASWHDCEGQLYSVIFTEEGLQSGRWLDGVFYAEDHEGDETKVCFYDLQKRLINEQHKRLAVPAVSVLCQIEDQILSVANLFDELTTSDLQGLAGAKARVIFNLVKNDN